VTPQEAARRLAEAGVPDPQRDARRLWDWVLEQTGGDTSDPVTLAAYGDAITRRAARVPVSRIIGRRSFWKHEFEISDAVLDPRPDTETLVEIALGSEFDTVLDLGTGSGCILLSLWRSGPGHAGPAPTSRNPRWRSRAAMPRGWGWSGRRSCNRTGSRVSRGVST
jgi:release factor glutamine methyltransferase